MILALLILLGLFAAITAVIVGHIRRWRPPTANWRTSGRLATIGLILGYVCLGVVVTGLGDGFSSMVTSASSLAA
jgi:hypothetical protein